MFAKAIIALKRGEKGRRVLTSSYKRNGLDTKPHSLNIVCTKISRLKVKLSDWGSLVKYLTFIYLPLDRPSKNK